jgi:hypothetical protein
MEKRSEASNLTTLHNLTVYELDRFQPGTNTWILTLTSPPGTCL